MVADPECRPDTIDLADAHMQVKTLSQFHLDGGGRGLRSFSTPLFEKGSCYSTQFAGMTVPSIGERYLTMLSEDSP